MIDEGLDSGVLLPDRAGQGSRQLLSQLLLTLLPSSPFAPCSEEGRRTEEGPAGFRAPLRLLRTPTLVSGSLLDLLAECSEWGWGLSGLC